eukprot:g13143.t1
MASVKHGNKKTGSVPVMECPFCGIPVVPSCDHFLFGCQGKEAFGRIRSEVFPPHVAGGGVKLEDRAAFIKGSPSKVLKYLARCAKEVPQGILPPSVGELLCEPIPGATDETQAPQDGAPPPSESEREGQNRENLSNTEPIKFGEQKKAKKREETTVTDKVVQDYAEWIARFV